MKTTIPFSDLIVFSLLVSGAVSAHPVENRQIEFPDIPGYQTLLADLHQHTVFSDGHVWPTVRVWEAEADGISVIATTDHLEWRPHDKDVPFTNSNRAFELASEEAVKSGKVLVLNGGEVSRDLPPGHVNAVFLKDVNALFIDDPMEVFRVAAEQDAFIFWNHPNWVAQRSDGMAELSDMHRELIARGQLHGIEVVNEYTYSDEAVQIALEQNLTMLGNSDVHGLVDYDFDVMEGGHRPVTLVFATEKTKPAVKEALFERRTAVCIDDTLIGRKALIQPLVKACISPVKTEILHSYKGETLVIDVLFENRSSIDYIFENQSPFTLHNQPDIFTLPAQKKTVVQVKIMDKLPEFEIPFRVLNAVVAPKQHPIITYTIETPTWTEEVPGSGKN